MLSITESRTDYLYGVREGLRKSAQPLTFTLGIYMKIILRTLGAAIWFLTFSVVAQDKITNDIPISILSAAKPMVNWDAKSAVNADVTCDGKVDTAVVGYEKDEAIWLGVVSGAVGNKPTKPVTMRFLVGKETQDSFCSSPVEIEVQPIGCEDDDIGALPGCKEVKGCSEFSMIDSSCDSFHFYWDSSKKKLVWWRR